MQGSVETTANQITLDRVLGNLRLGISIMAQNVGISGITKAVAISTTLSSIYKILVVSCNTGTEFPGAYAGYPLD